MPFVLGVLRYALLLEQGGGGAPEELVLSDRVLLAIGAVWAVLVRGRRAWADADARHDVRAAHRLGPHRADARDRARARADVDEVVDARAPRRTRAA